MLVDLNRTFSEYKLPSDAGKEQDWSEYFDHGQRSHTWTELHERPLAIVLGEAGIGKTSEFKSEVARLKAQGEAAFFIPLNLLSSGESWHLALGEYESDYAAWEDSGAIAHVFLDAVDEARLKSHADFEKALLVVQRTLRPHLGRVRIAISSRVTDWSSAAVRSAVHDRLVKLMERSAVTRLPEHPEPGGTTETIPLPPERAAGLEAFVVTLDPLSSAEARRCAAAFSVEDSERFWAAVGDGEYEFMATRPLDLLWMVALWNQRRTLGTYRDLIEANVANRLREFNPNYEAAGEVLSVDQLRAGATELAAAAEFGGCSFFSTELGSETAAGVLAPDSVLADWKSTAIRRLLATAVFDEASYGRVQFHHRSVREYLAAQWVASQLTLGVPLQRIQHLFAGRPFGVSALIPSHRAALSWLAAIHVEAREWVTREFPEILCFEGDPQSWDRPSADAAFTRLVMASAEGVQLDWFSSASEYRRVGRSVSPGRIAAVIADRSASPRFRSVCFRIAWHAKLAECANVSFDVYRDASSEAWLRTSGLEVLERVGSPEQRREVLNDLTSGKLASNELIAEALTVVDWKQFTATQLSAVFDLTRREQDSFGPMAKAIKETLLPNADLPVAMLLLGAVMASLPRPSAGRRFARFPDSEQPERAWLLSVLTACFERVLELLPQPQLSVDELVLEAAERIEAMRDSGFTNKTELDRLHRLIARHPMLRWTVALAIAQSDEIQASLHRLTWGSSCLVSFDTQDVPELTKRANDLALAPEHREIWFAVAMYLVFREKRGHERVAGLRALAPHEVGSARHAALRDAYVKVCRNARTTRHWRMEDRERKAEAERQDAQYKAEVMQNLAAIRDGTHQGWLRSLLQFAFTRFSPRDYSDIDFERMARELSPEIAEGFRSGLMACWPAVKPPNPSDFSDGQVPWVALLALAGLNCSLYDEGAAARVPAELAGNAAQLAVWELNGPRGWFLWLARSHPLAVAAALRPWLLSDARASGTGMRRSLEAVLRCPSDVRRALLEPLVPLVASDEIPQRQTLNSVIVALREEGLLPTGDVATMCRNRLPACVGPDGRLTEMGWLGLWMEADAVAAWHWFVAHLETLGVQADAELAAFAGATVDLKWGQAPLSQSTANVLVQLHAKLGGLPAVAAAASDESSFFGPPQKHLRDAIPNLFVSTRGPIGHHGLAALLPSYSSPLECQWMRGRLIEHASLDLAEKANRSPAELRSISSPFASPPASEAQLLEQGFARLQEIRKNLEEGPFSERDLFYPGIPEKYLQRWLAAKLRETQNRRFSVHREEEVDVENMPDIQLSCQAGNVCIEIKPLDSKRSYSANSLTETLRTQIVGQYLKGTNSSRGILVLLQLDTKTWEVPGVGLGQPFEALVSYLEAQAERIRRDASNVEELLVFGMRCTA